MKVVEVWILKRIILFIVRANPPLPIWRAVLSPGIVPNPLVEVSIAPKVLQCLNSASSAVIQLHLQKVEGYSVTR